MNSDTPLDYAFFQLSPRRSRCELFVSGNGNTEKLASGFVKPFIAHLKFAEEQVARADTSIKLEVEKSRNGNSWFNKGTIERFVRFVSTPEVLESVNTYDAEMSQLEGARRIYSLGSADPLPRTLGEDETTAVAADVTKKELLKAIDVRLVTVKQDLATACSRACSAGFSIENVSELLIFAEHFGANRIKEACNKFISLSQRHPDLIGQQQQSQSQPLLLKSLADGNISSSSSDMSTDDPELEHNGVGKSSDCGGLQLHVASINQVSQLNTKELSDTPEQVKPIQQHLEIAVAEESAASQANDPALQDGKRLRRLSVQDRINLFESKQKEQPGTSRNISTQGVVNRVVQRKGEHRRFPSDVSEKSVLRRWSGVSDLSIDLGSSNSKSFNDQSESGSAVGTPTSANLQLQSKSKTEETEVSCLKDTLTSQCWLGLKESTVDTSHSLLLSQSQCKGLPGDRDCTEEEGDRFFITKARTALEKGQNTHSASLSRMDYCGLGNQVASRSHQTGFPENSNEAGSKDNATNHIQLKPEGHAEMENQAILPVISQTVLAVNEHVRWRDQEDLQHQTKEFPSLVGRVGLKDQRKVANQLQTFGRRIDPDFKAKGPSVSQNHFKCSPEMAAETDLLASQSQGKVFPAKVEEAWERNASVSNGNSGSSLFMRSEDINHQGINWHQLSAPERSGDELAYTERNLSVAEEVAHNKTKSVPAFSMRKAKETLNIVEPSSACLVEQLQLARLSKGNEELNYELEMKANELEKLFAAHKLKNLSEQTPSCRRTRLMDVQEDNISMDVEKRHAVNLTNQLTEKNPREIFKDELDVDANLLLKMLSNEDCDGTINQNSNKLSPSNDSRGKFYYKYMQKRDTKLQEEWGTKGVEKEEKMKAILDSLECSQAEMKSKYSGSDDKQRSKCSRRSENLQSFSNCSSLRSKKQQAVDSVQEYRDVEGCAQDTTYGSPFGDQSSTNSNTMKLLSTKTLSSSTSQTLVASVPKPILKPTKSVSIRRRSQTENLIAESLPNFYEFRKENAKPSAANNRVNIQEKTRMLSRSNSTIEESNLVKEDKTHRSQSMRKTTAITGDFKELSPLNSDGSNLTPLGFSKAQRDHPNIINEVQKSGEFKPFLRKGKGSLHSFRATLANVKTSKVSEVNKNEDDSDSIAIKECLPDLDKDMEMERSSTGGDFENANFPVGSDSEKLQHSQKYENSEDFESETDDQRSLSQADCDTVPATPKFGTSSGNAQGSPGGSPWSWNPHLHNSFSYAHEASDIDASTDSPVGSPASWNLLPNQMETDVTRMRKKWGTAQVPMIVANAPHQSCNDVAKGFKRVLKFERKSRGVESLFTDWVSVSTASDGDDDTEDGHYLVVRATDDLRKSRMGYSLPRDGFSERVIFSEQAQFLHSSIPNPPANFKSREDHLIGSSLKAPRSFFSLSSFRSKESRPR